MVYVHFANGFEEIEAITIVDLLRRAEIEVSTVSLSDSLFVTGTHNISVKCDYNIKDVDYNNCNMIVLPGGMPGTLNLLESNILSNAIDDFVYKNKYIAAICAAPMILGRKNLLCEKYATIYPGMENELIGSIICDDAVVCSDNIITAKGPYYAINFALKLIELLKDKQTSEQIAKDILFR